MENEVITKTRRMLRERGICVVIPVYNNAASIADVVRRSLVYCDDVYVVSDGSTDGSDAIVADIRGAKLISYKKNRGKGHALKTAFRRARTDGFAYAITIDADGQHRPEEIPLFLKANMKYPGEIIIGRRDMKGVVRSRGSRFANSFSNFWFAVQTGRRNVDTQSGYRLMPLKKLPPSWLISARYESELEYLVLPIWNGVGLHQVDIDVFYPSPEDRVSHFRPGRDFARISILNTFLTLGAAIYGWPAKLLRGFWIGLVTAYAIVFTVIFVMGVITPVVKLRFAFGKNEKKKERWIHRTIRWGARVVMIHHGLPGGKFRAVERDKSWCEEPSIVICNHQSHFDLLCQLVFTPNIVFLTNDWVWKNPIYGAIIRRAEYCPVREGLEEILPKLKDLVARGYSIAVFPEGSRSADCRIRRFHQGAFYLARELCIGITPMCLYGTGRYLPKGSHILHKSPIVIEVGEPISRARLDKMGSPREQASEMRKFYEKWYLSMKNRIEQNV